MKLLEEHIGEVLQDIEMGKGFWKMSHMAQITKAKIDK
jgi:hypothetical protein